MIGGVLMDAAATTAEFRDRYMATVCETAAPVLWTDIDTVRFHEAALGELSQAIGAALLVRDPEAAERDAT